MRERMPDYPPEFDEPTICRVCLRDVDECDCPECPECFEIGDPDCFGRHMPYHVESVAQFIADRGFGTTLGDTMRAIDRHGEQWVSLMFRQPILPGVREIDASRAGSSERRERLDAIPLATRIAEVVTGTHACGHDAEFSATCPPGDPDAFDAAQENVADMESEWWAEHGEAGDIDAEGL